MESEGKTLSSANLAVVMARTGNRVVLLDCDMRRPRLHTIFGLERDTGVSNILVGDCSIQDAVQQTEVENLFMIPCGELPPNPSELLGSQAMLNLLATLGSEYDRIIIDSPPVTAVTDPVVLSQIVDGVVIVVQANSTERIIVRRAIDQMKAVDAHIFGVVLNKLDEKMTKYYHLYSYFYRYYGEDEKRSAEEKLIPMSWRGKLRNSVKKLRVKKRVKAGGDRRRLTNRYSDSEKEEKG
jgi:capsular exopolysaccharide synthesis family protein